jgi:pyrroline-5-carboxylate reductase
MMGTAKLLMENKTDPQELIKSVASAKGTTAAGLAVLEKSSVGAILQKTIAAAAQRSRELSV